MKHLFFTVCTLFSLNFLFMTASVLPPEILLRNLENDNVSFVMFSFCDLLGNLKQITMPIGQVKSVFTNGTTFDGSSIIGYSSITESDLIIKPDLSTLVYIPWSPESSKTAWFICDIYKSDTEPYENDPRFILKKALNNLSSLGFQLLVGPELEFFLFKKDSTGNLLNPVDNQRYFDPEYNMISQQDHQELISFLTKVGVPAEKIHHEVAPGQYEISIEYNDALTMADTLIRAKYAIQVWAEKKQLHATFMAKPLTNQNGSGMHLHFSLYNIEQERNAFYSSDNAYYLADCAQQFLAGVLSSIHELQCFFNTTINSYKRLVPGYEAPIFICWGAKNRSALIRIPLMTADPEKGMRAEIRCPDSLCNPYLAFAALGASGTKGLLEKQVLPDPTQDNLYNLSLDTIENRGIKTLSSSLAQAVEACAQSTLAQELLGAKAFTEFITLKRKEYQASNRAVTDWEKEWYY